MRIKAFAAAAFLRAESGCHRQGQALRSSPLTISRKLIRGWFSAATLAALLVLPTPASADLISGTFNFAATVNSTTYSGTFYLKNLDTTLSYTDSTAAGFSVITNFDTSGDGGNVFSYNPTTEFLTVGGLLNSLNAAGGTSNDWVLSVVPFPLMSATSTSLGIFAYYPSSGTRVLGAMATIVDPPGLPEPGTVALLGLGLASLAGVFAIRHRKQTDREEPRQGNRMAD